MKRRGFETTGERLGVIAAIGAIAIAGSVTLADDTEGQTEGRVIRKIEVLEADGPMPHTVIENSFVTDEGHAIEVQMADGEISVRVNGEEIPAGRVIQKDGHITILDAEGNEIRRVGIGHFGPGDHVMEFRFGDGENRFWVAGDDQFVVAEPTVMLGIHLGVPGPALERHLRLEPGTTTMVTALFEGLPAHAAGLGEYDVITEINGDTPADPGTLRTALATMEPGDVVRLEVIQEGDEREVRVKLEAFDREAMSGAKLIGGAGDFFFAPGVDGRMRGEMRFGLPGAAPFGEMKDFNRFFLDDENRVFEMLPPGRLEWQEESEGDTDLDQRLHRLDRRLAGLEKLLDDLLEEAKRGRRER